MKKAIPLTKEQQLGLLRKQVEKLQAQLVSIDAAATPASPFAVRMSLSQSHFKRVRDPQRPDMGIGEFFSLVEITSVDTDVFIPLSIASSKKPTGFVYQIEGTASGALETTDISCKGKGVTQITLGTILYIKIPKGVTATFRILITMNGKMQHTYFITINRIHYKLNPSDARYVRFSANITSESLKLQ